MWGAEREIKNAGSLKGRVIQAKHFFFFVRTLLSRVPHAQLSIAPVPYLQIQHKPETWVFYHTRRLKYIFLSPLHDGQAPSEGTGSPNPNSLSLFYSIWGGIWWNLAHFQGHKHLCSPSRESRIAVAPWCVSSTIYSWQNTSDRAYTEVRFK